MAQNGKDTSGNWFKYSLIPLLLGCVVIFFLYRSCGNSIHHSDPQPLSSDFVLTPEEKAALEEANAKTEEAVETPVVVEETPVETEVANDSLQ